MAVLGYKLPEVKAMLIVDVAIALGVYREPELPELAPGYAYSDPADPRSHLRMRHRHGEVANRIAFERYGCRWLDLDEDRKREVRAEAVKLAPLPVPRPMRTVGGDVMETLVRPYTNPN